MMVSRVGHSFHFFLHRVRRELATVLPFRACARHARHDPRRRACRSEGAERVRLRHRLRACVSLQYFGTDRQSQPSAACCRGLRRHAGVLGLKLAQSLQLGHPDTPVLRFRVVVRRCPDPCLRVICATATPASPSFRIAPILLFGESRLLHWTLPPGKILPEKSSYRCLPGGEAYDVKEGGNPA
jgi:hypothetical protein